MAVSLPGDPTNSARRTPWEPAISSAALSPIMIDAAFVLPLTIFGMTLRPRPRRAVIDEAERIAREIHDEFIQAWALARIANAVLQGTRHSRARLGCRRSAG